MGGPTDLRFLLGNPLCGLGAALRVGGSFAGAFLLSPPKEGSKKGAAGSEAAAARLKGPEGPLRNPGALMLSGRKLPPFS